MNSKLNISSTIYANLQNGDSSAQLSRNDKIAIAIEVSLDRVFMATFCRRSTLSDKSTKYVRSTIISAGSAISALLQYQTLNQAENQVLADLAALTHSILVEDYIPRMFTAIGTLEALIDNASVDPLIKNMVAKSARLVLAVTNQIDYQDETIVVPHIRVFETINYVKCLSTIEVMFRLTRIQSITQPDNTLYRLFDGLRFTSATQDVDDVLNKLCVAINIGTVPDAVTGIGIRRFLYEAYVSSDLLKRFVVQSGAEIIDVQSIKATVLRNNPAIERNSETIAVVGSLEADFTDAVSAEDEKKADESTDPDKTVDAEKPAETDPPVDAEDDTEVTDENAELADSEDDTDVAPEEEPTDQGDSLTEVETEPKPVLLGMNLVLSQNETLDNFLYKLSAARYIDTVIEFNHDDLPIETVTILTKWKSSMLFLADAVETKRLFDDLKIKLQ